VLPSMKINELDANLRSLRSIKNQINLLQEDLQELLNHLSTLQDQLLDRYAGGFDEPKN